MSINGEYEVKTFMSKGNYVGLTVELSQVKTKLYHRDTWSKPFYKVVVKYIVFKEAGDWEKGSSRQFEEDSFELKEQVWKYDKPIEAAGKFEKIRNQVRHLGEFRNLNKGKIPDYRDEPK